MRDPYKDPQKFVYLLYGIRVIVSISFLMAIVIFHKFYYFYKCLFLLLIVLLINSFLFILKDTS